MLRLVLLRQLKHKLLIAGLKCYFKLLSGKCEFHMSRFIVYHAVKVNLLKVTGSPSLFDGIVDFLVINDNNVIVFIYNRILYCYRSAPWSSGCATGQRALMVHPGPLRG